MLSNCQKVNEGGKDQKTREREREMEAAAVTDIVANVCGHRVNFFPFAFPHFAKTKIPPFIYFITPILVFLSFAFNLHVYGDCFFR